MHAHREDAPAHAAYRRWLRTELESPEAFGVSSTVLAGFVRIVTHPRIFSPPTPVKTALAFVRDILSRPNCVEIRPGERHWQIFEDLCLAAKATGNLVPDAWLAALAIESGSEWVTSDGDYARFPGLRWRRPDV